MKNKIDDIANISTAKVLLIDDDHEFRDSLTEVLEESGFNVTSASSLDEATRLLERSLYQVIITDMYFDASMQSGDKFLLQNKELIGKASNVLITGQGISNIKKLSELSEMGVQIFEKGSTEFLDDIKNIIQESSQVSKESNEEITEDQKTLEQDLVAVAMFGDKIKLVSLTPDGHYHALDEEQNIHNIFYIAPSETLALQAAIEELESLINDPNTKEKDFQAFFERNPDFILNDDYKKAHPHIVLAKDDGGELIPDFVLEPIEQSALCDLLELKLPSAQIFVLKKSRMRFSSAVLEACAQLREYALFFDEERNREVVKEKYGLLAFKPKMFVIIGRRGTVSPIDVRKIEGDVPNLHLRTYDDIVQRMKARFDAMKKGKFRS